MEPSMSSFPGLEPEERFPGVSRYIKKEKDRKIISVAVEPAESPVITQRLAGMELKPGPHKIQGIGAGFIPDTLDLSLVDRVETVTSEEAIEHARRLAREEGILSGISCGAAIAVALRLAGMDEFEGKTIVAILPDSGERYLSGPLFEGLFDESGASKNMRDGAGRLFRVCRGSNSADEPNLRSVPAKEWGSMEMMVRKDFNPDGPSDV